MRSLNPRILVLVAALAAAVGLIVLAGCDSKPAAPVFGSPWDPDGPDGGDALQVSAIAGDTTINVTWNQPQGLGIEVYVVGHSLDPADGWEDIAEVNATTLALGLYTYHTPAPTTLHYFRVQAFTASEYSIVGYGRTGTAFTPPRVVPATGAKTRASRHLDLLITVTAGDSLRLADNDSFAGATTIPVETLGTSQVVSWDLGEAADNTAFTVYVKTVETSGYGSPVSSTDFTAGFGPHHYVAGRPTTLATRAVDLVVPSEGVTAMRFALSADALATAPWLAPADTVPGFLLADSANPQVVYGEFEGDFGYTKTYDLPVTPDDLSTAAFTLLVPPSRVIDGPTVQATCSARATLMRFAESPSFSGVPWQAYDDTATITLSAGEGRKVVYAQFRNDWADSPVLTAYVDVVTQPVDVTFLAPLNGATLTGGTALQVRGTALAGTASDHLDSVRVDLGDGLGWRAPAGTTSWALMWDVPSTDGDVTLRARAWVTNTNTSARDSATTAITVTVQIP